MVFLFEWVQQALANTSFDAKALACRWAGWLAAEPLADQ
jgi:hypothetical protein